MVPSKPEDFTGTHGGFEGEEEGVGYLLPGDTVEVFTNRGDLSFRYTATTSGWLTWTPHALDW
jgi:hypothetical protein